VLCADCLARGRSQPAQTQLAGNFLCADCVQARSMVVHFVTCTECGRGVAVQVGPGQEPADVTSCDQHDPPTDTEMVILDLDDKQPVIDESAEVD
jgi:hypothetical protein